MRGLLPSVWLLLAGLYTASLLALIQPFSFGRGLANAAAPQ